MTTRMTTNASTRKVGKAVRNFAETGLSSTQIERLKQILGQVHALTAAASGQDGNGVIVAGPGARMAGAPTTKTSAGPRREPTS